MSSMLGYRIRVTRTNHGRRTTHTFHASRYLTAHLAELVLEYFSPEDYPYTIEMDKPFPKKRLENE